MNFALAGDTHGYPMPELRAIPYFYAGIQLDDFAYRSQDTLARDALI